MILKKLSILNYKNILHSLLLGRLFLGIFHQVALAQSTAADHDGFDLIAFDNRQKNQEAGYQRVNTIGAELQNQLPLAVFLLRHLAIHFFQLFHFHDIALFRQFIEVTVQTANGADTSADTH